MNKEQEQLLLMLMLKHGMSHFRIWTQYVTGNIKLSVKEAEVVSNLEFKILQDEDNEKM